MNKRNIRTLIRLVAQSDDFDMSHYAKCFIGLAAKHLNEKPVPAGTFGSRRLVKWLGIGVEEPERETSKQHTLRLRLYVATGGPRLEDITKERAIRMLEHLHDTGEIDWYAGER